MNFHVPSHACARSISLLVGEELFTSRKLRIGKTHYTNAISWQEHTLHPQMKQSNIFKNHFLSAFTAFILRKYFSLCLYINLQAFPRCAQIGAILNWLTWLGTITYTKVLFRSFWKYFGREVEQLGWEIKMIILVKVFTLMPILSVASSSQSEPTLKTCVLVNVWIWSLNIMIWLLS